MCNKCNDCNDCNPCNPCKCENRYNGPDILPVGITSGMTYDEVLEILSNYTSDVDFSDGVGIESEGYNPLTGVLTLNFTDGTSYSTGDLRGPAGANGATGPAGPNQLLIENTILVSKNGNNSTGTRNDWAKPFLTIAAANSVAQAGDLVIVYPGTYNEGDVAKSNVNYYFYKGAVVSSGIAACISDSVGQAKNIFIYGEGDFISTSNRGLFTQNQDTNIIFRFNHIEGFDGILVGNANYINIKGSSAKALTQYTVSIRGNSSGVVDIDFYDGSVSSNKGQTILIRNASLDSTPRELFVKGKRLVSNCEFLQGAITTENCDYLTTYVSIDSINHVTSSDSFTTSAIWHQSGRLKVTGAVRSTNNFGVILGNNGGDTILLLDNCQVSSNNSALSAATATANIYAEVINSELNKTSAMTTPTVSLGATAGPVEVSLIGTGVRNLSTDSAAHGIEITDANPVVRIRDVKIDIASATADSVSSPVARTIFIESILTTNKAMDANVTNGVTGSSVIVDTDIKRNTKVFN